MKRFACALSCVLLVLSACGAPAQEQPENSQTVLESSTTADPVLEELTDALGLVHLDTARIDVDEMTFSDPEAVLVTRNLLDEIGSALLEGNPQVLDPPERVCRDQEKFLRIQLRTTDDTYICVELFKNSVEQPGKTMLWLQIGEEQFQYTLDNAAFDKICELIAAQTKPKKVMLNGAYATYRPGTDEWRGANLLDTLELPTGLVFLWRQEEEYRLELVNPQDGSVVWQLEFEMPGQYEHGISKLEPASFERYDFRIVGNSRVTYYNSRNREEPKNFEKPNLEEMSGPRVFRLKYSYDIDSAADVFAYSDDDGVYVGKLSSPANPALMLANRDLEQPGRADGSPVTSEFEAYYYGNVHLLNHGRQLVASIIHPGSQIGLHSLALLDLETGETTVFEDIFSAMVADVRYPDYRTVAAVAIDRVTLIDALSKAKKALPFDARAVTADFKTCFCLTRSKGEDGETVGALEMSITDKPKAAREMLTYSGQNVSLCGAAKHYALLLCKDSEDEYIAIVPTRPVNALPVPDALRKDLEERMTQYLQSDPRNLDPIEEFLAAHPDFIMDQCPRMNTNHVTWIEDYGEQPRLKGYSTDMLENPLLNWERFAAFVENCKAGIPDSVAVFSWGSHVLCWITVFTCGDGGGYAVESYSGSSYWLEYVEELEETDKEWIMLYTNQSKIRYPKYGFEPLPLKENSGVVSQEAALALIEPLMRKHIPPDLMLRIEPDGREMIDGVECYLFRAKDVYGSPYFSYAVATDLSRYYEGDSAHGSWILHACPKAAP